MARNFYDPSSCSWYRLDLDITAALRPEFIEFCSQQPPDLYLFEPHQAFTQQWQTAVSLGYDIEFVNVLVFSRDDHELEATAHIDSLDIPLISAINWCIGPDHRPMQWWRVPSVINRPFVDTGYNWATTDQGILTRNRVDTDQHTDKLSHQQWYCSELELQDQCLIGNRPTLVRVDQPHGIAPGPSGRVCVSARFHPLNRSWTETVTHFARNILPLTS
jgi:hypothetical protein